METQEIPIKTSTFAIREHSDEVFIQVYSLFVMVKKIFRQKNTIFLVIISWHPLDMPSLLYQTRRKNPLVIKGLNNSDDSSCWKKHNIEKCIKT